MIYFIKPKGKQGPIKIGHTKNIKKRFANIQNMNPFALELVATKSGTKSLEKFLHKKFKERQHGEWFTPTPQLLKYIEDCLSQTPLCF